MIYLGSENKYLDRYHQFTTSKDLKRTDFHEN